MGAFEGSTYSVAFQVLLLVFSILAAICSITVLFLIHKMKLKNGHILLIKTMSWFQLLYDLTIFTRSVDLGNSVVLQISFIGQIVGGLVGTFISNVIAFIALYVISSIKAIPVYKHYPYIMLGIAIPTTVTTVVYIIGCVPGYSYLENVAMTDLYFYLRLASIAFNFILSFATMYQIRRQSAQTDMMKSIHQEAIETLAIRLIYYPVVQTISRGAIAWYELEYSFDLSPPHPTTNEFIGMCFVAVLTPSASFGYLWIFLLMQPNAWECLKSTLSGRKYVPKRNVLVSNPNYRSSQVRTSQEITTKNTLHSMGTGVATYDSETLVQCVYPHNTTLSGNTSSVCKMVDVDDDDLWFVINNNERATEVQRNHSIERASGEGM